VGFASPLETRFTTQFLDTIQYATIIIKSDLQQWKVIASAALSDSELLLTSHLPFSSAIAWNVATNRLQRLASQQYFPTLKCRCYYSEHTLDSRIAEKLQNVFSVGHVGVGLCTDMAGQLLREL